MGLGREAQIAEAVREVQARGESWCATFEMSNDPARWVQFTIDAINVAYPHAEDPSDRLRVLGVLTVVAWEPNKYASVTIASDDAGAVAAWIERYFADILSYGGAASFQTTFATAEGGSASRKCPGFAKYR